MRVEKTIQAWMNLPWNEMESMQGESSMNETTLDEPVMKWNMQGERQACNMRKTTPQMDLKACTWTKFNAEKATNTSNGYFTANKPTTAI